MATISEDKFLLQAEYCDYCEMTFDGGTSLWRKGPFSQSPKLSMFYFFLYERMFLSSCFIKTELTPSCSLFQRNKKKKNTVAVGARKTQMGNPNLCYISKSY